MDRPDATNPEAIIVGCSQGGFHALTVLLGGLDTRLAQACLVCCHTSGSIASLCDLLNNHSRLPVTEARERHPILGGAVYVAPGNYHLLLENERHFALSVDPPVRFSRPSIDVMFASAADVYRSALIGVILTGANQDGAEGLARVRQRGGLAVVQTPESAEAPAMPSAALETAGADYCVTLEQVAPLLNYLCGL